MSTKDGEASTACIPDSCRALFAAYFVQLAESVAVWSSSRVIKRLGTPRTASRTASFSYSNFGSHANPGREPATCTSRQPRIPQSSSLGSTRVQVMPSCLSGRCQGKGKNENPHIFPRIPFHFPFSFPFHSPRMNLNMFDAHVASSGAIAFTGYGSLACASGGHGRVACSC